MHKSPLHEPMKKTHKRDISSPDNRYLTIQYSVWKAYAKASNSTSSILSLVRFINSFMLVNCSLYRISYFRLNSNLTVFPLKEITALLWSISRLSTSMPAFLYFVSQMNIFFSVFVIEVVGLLESLNTSLYAFLNPSIPLSCLPECSQSPTHRERRA